MFVPFISTRSGKSRNLERRKGGGGGGKGGGGGGKSSSGGGSKGSTSGGSSGSTPSKGGSGGGSSGGGSAPKAGPKSSSVGFPSSGSGSTKTKPVKTTTYSSNTARVAPAVAIGAGLPFAGRLQGGAGRSQVYGSRYYGSGYPGVTGRGTAGRNFPFFFWPVVFPTTLGFGAGYWYGPYHNGRQDYGDPTNSTRPGGPQVVATFQSSASNNPTATFRVMSDNFTVYSLIDDLSANCSSHNLITSSVLSSVSQFTDSANSLPRPESVIQYYRASSISLSLDSYNNSAATYSYTDDTPDAPITGLNAGDLDLMNCLNDTIGLAAPLVSAAGPSWRMNGVALGGGNGVMILPVVVGVLVASVLG